MKNTLRSRLLVSLLTTAFLSPAVIAADAPRPAETMLASFANVTGTREGVETLQKVHAAGLPRSPANIAAVRKALSSKVTDEEKIVLIRILGGMSSPQEKTVEQSAILSDLKSFTHSGKKEIARAATFAVSRAGYSSDSQEVLKRGKSSGLLSKDEYFGELSHMLRFAPKQDQQAIITSLESEGNAYGVDVLTMNLADKALVSSLYPDTKKSLQKMLRKNEPNFPMALGSFGLIDGFRYSNWLHSYALLNENLDGTAYVDTVLKELMSDKTDPRKVVAFLSSAEGKSLMQKVGTRAPFDAAAARAQKYAESFPQNSMAADIVSQISMSMSTLK